MVDDSPKNTKGLPELLDCIHKGYRNALIDENEFKEFIKSFLEYWNESQKERSANGQEATIKDMFKDFLSKCLKRNRSDIELAVERDNQDLTISKEKLEVIFEFKRPDSTDMIKENDLNKKALHQAIHYLYEQTTKKENYYRDLSIKVSS